jgi:hypothetical protein
MELSLRCMAGSLLIGVGKRIHEIREVVLKAIDELRVDDTTTNLDAGIGPLRCRNLHS